MRIVAGKFRSRRINAPQNIPARPTTDFAKESLFNILNNHFDFDAISFLDLFAGTGSITYEMASSGCEDMICVEKDGRSVEFIKKTIKELDINAVVMRMDVFEYLRSTRRKFDIIFAGTPYALLNLKDIPDEIFDAQLLNEKGWFILEHHKHQSFDEHPHFKSKRNYGTTVFSIFE